MVLIGRLATAALAKAGWAPKAVGGLTMGADPVAFAIAAASHGTPAQVDAFSVRKDTKEHGMGRQIEGNFTAGDEVVVVEDVITTGGSAEQAISAVVSSGGIVLGVLAVVDRGEGGERRSSGEGAR